MDIEIDSQAKTVIFRGQGNTEHHYHRGDIIGESYQLIDLIGQGGMGVVYRAKHLILGKEYALKLLAPTQINNQSWRRFELEGRSLAKLKHNNIVAIYNMGIDKGCPYFVMDWLEGVSLADQIKGSGPLTEKENLDIYMQVCAGLTCAHKSGIIHRDIKPANIMLVPTATGVVAKIVDFGLARLQTTSDTTVQALTASGEVFGSPYYMSPEQTRGEEIDARSDIYSLGCSLFETLTGRVPLAGSTAIQTLMMHQDQEPPAPSSIAKISPAFDVVVARCLNKEAKQRYQSAEQLAIDLQRIADGKPIGNAARIIEIDRGLEANVFLQEKTKQIDDGYDTLSTLDGSPSFFTKHGKLFFALLTLICIASVAALYLPTGTRPKPVASPKIPNESSHPGMNMQEDQADSLFEKAKDEKSVIKEFSYSPLQDIETEDRAFVTTNSAMNQKVSTVSAALDHIQSFSQGVKNIDGREMRCFKFPSSISIGKIRAESTGHYEAKGEVRLPAGENIILHIGSLVSDYPALVDKFGPDEITNLRIENHHSVGSIIKHLNRWKRLQTLTIDGGAIQDSDLSAFDQLKQLNYLWLKRLDFDYKKFVSLSCLKHLVHLQLEDCEQVNQILQHLPPMPNLMVVSLEGRGPDWLRPATIAALAKQPNLKTLCLKSKNRSDYDTITTIDSQTRREDEAMVDPIFVCRHEIAKLKGVNDIQVNKPKWTKEMKAEFVRELPAARGNAWAKNLGYFIK